MPKTVKKTSSKKVATKENKSNQKIDSSVSSGVKSSNLSVNLTNILAMVVVLLIAGLVSWGVDVSKKNNPNNQQQAVAAVSSIAYNGQDGKNALDLLKENNKIETQDSSFGIFVTTINGIQNTNNQYWMFYVNGELSSTAPDQYQSKNSDKIEWRYQDISGFSAN